MSPPTTMPPHAPPKWKMALLTWAAIFPTLAVVLGGTAEALAGLPGPLRLFIVTAAIVPLMTWVLMPALTRLARPWLLRP